MFPDDLPSFPPFDLASWYAQQDALDLAEAWEEHSQHHTMLDRLTRWAKRLARQERPGVLFSLEEFRRACPMPPPTTRVRVLSPWT